MEKPLQKVFNTENLLWRIVSYGVDIVGLSLAWAFLCLPIVTAGPATSALYYTVVKCLRQKEKRTFKIFWESFKSCLKRGIIITLIAVPAGIVLAIGYSIMKLNWSSAQGAVMFVAYDVALVVPIGVLCWLLALTARFDMKLSDSFRTAFRLAFRHLPSTVIVVLLWVETAILLIERWWPVFFAPTAAAFFTSLFLERIFPKYLSEEDRKLLKTTSETPTEEQESENR